MISSTVTLSTKAATKAKKDAGSRKSHFAMTSVRLREQVIDLIRTGEIAIGERLDQRQLAKKLKTTTAPLREALSALESEGLLVRQQGLGVFSRIYTVSEVEELIEIRGVLEGLAARRATAYLNDDLLEELRQMAEFLGKPIAAGGEKDYVAAHINFHKRIVEISRSTRLQSLLEFHHFIDCVLSNIASTFWGVSAHDHMGLVQALASRNPKKAEEAMRKHIAPTYQERLGILRKRFGEGPILPLPSAS
jgi:DNA-binding GntR family transcriptional regulator